MSSPPTSSTSTEGTMVRPKKAITSFARNLENGRPRRRSTNSFTTFRARKRMSARSIVRSAAENAYSTTSLRKSGLSPGEWSANHTMAASAPKRRTIPSRIRRGLSRKGRRSGGVGAADRTGSVGRRASRTVVIAPRSRSTLRFLQFVDFALELPDVAELAVDRGKPDVRDLVQLFELLHQARADLLGRHLA